jgi:hypothetical protein
MELVPPECSLHPSSPCTEQDWRQCAACGRLVCTIHDDLIAVLYSGVHPTETDQVCSACVEAIYENGEVSMGNPYQWINRR